MADKFGFWVNDLPPVVRGFIPDRLRSSRKTCDPILLK